MSDWRANWRAGLRPGVPRRYWLGFIPVDGGHVRSLGRSFLAVTCGWIADNFDCLMPSLRVAHTRILRLPMEAWILVVALGAIFCLALNAFVEVRACRIERVLSLNLEVD